MKKKKINLSCRSVFIILFSFVVFIFLFFQINSYKETPPENKVSYESDNSKQINNVEQSVKEKKVNPFSFSFAGDYGANINTLSVLKIIKKISPDFHLALGDLKYKDVKTESDWCDFVKDGVGNVPFVLISGNHESDGRDGHIDKFVDCLPFPLTTKMTGSYAKNYFFDYPVENPQVRFIMISPNIHFTEEQIEYRKDNPLMKELVVNINNAKKQNIPWIIVSAHKPCLSTEEKHKCETGIDLPKEIIEQGVDLYINGHSHIYERTFMLSCVEEDIADLNCIHKGISGVFKKGKGTVFVTAGTGGISLRETEMNSKLNPYFASIYASNKKPTFGIASVDIRQGELEFNFIDAKNGNSVDRFIIKK